MSAKSILSETCIKDQMGYFSVTVSSNGRPYKAVKGYEQVDWAEAWMVVDPGKEYEVTLDASRYFGPIMPHIGLQLVVDDCKRHTVILHRSLSPRVVTWRGAKDQNG